MLRQREEGDMKGGIIVPKDKFEWFVGFRRRNGRIDIQCYLPLVA
ncbi:MAG: hypothetical protein WBC40_00280 [Halobacteriota archaeon]